jgi:zinc transporter ZupT
MSIVLRNSNTSINETDYLFHLHLISETFTIEEDPKPYGAVLAATLLVNLATLSGLVLLVVPAVRKGLLRKAASDSKSHGKLIDIIIPSFASGALMATAVFLVLPEAFHLIEGVHEDGGEGDHSGHGHRFAKEEEADSEGATFAKWGCGILGGFLLPAFLSLFFFHGTKELDEEESAAASDEEECKSCMERDAIKEGADIKEGAAIPTTVMVRSEDPDSIYDADDVGADVPTDIATKDNALEELVTTQNDSAEVVDVKTKIFIDYRLVASVVIGDFFCNFADGLFIGAAFLGCSWATAVSITLIALLHEIPQELADFVILTRYAGCSMVHACALNFTTGLAVCFGGLIVLAAKPSDETVGIVLAIAGGVYLNLAASESQPRVANYAKHTSDKAWALLSFAIGTVPLGLILLDHKHC